MFYLWSKWHIRTVIFQEELFCTQLKNPGCNDFELQLVLSFFCSTLLGEKSNKISILGNQTNC